MKFSLITTLTALATSAAASPLDLEKRQCSTTWRYQYESRIAPSNYKAFNLGGCAGQLSFNKDQYIGVRWAFEATYADGSRTVHTPVRTALDFGASDTFYTNVGTNFITRSPGSSEFTSVHEFTNVCRGGQAPVSWRFYTTAPASNCYTTGQIRAVTGSRPAQVTGVSLRRANAAGDFQVSWSTVPRAAAYSVLLQYPTGTDEIGRPYVGLRGARVQGTSTQVATTTRRQDVARKVIVHAVDSQGVWSYTNDVRPVEAGW